MVKTLNELEVLKMRFFSVKNLLVVNIIGLVCLVIIIVSIIILNKKVNPLKEDVLSKYRSVESLKLNKIKLINRIDRILTKIERIKQRIGLDWTNKLRKEEIQHYFERLKIRNIQNNGILTYGQYDAIITALMLIGVIISIIIGIIISINGNISIGWRIAVILSIVIAVGLKIIPIISIQTTIKIKDEKLKEEFGDFYLTQHSILLSGTENPMTKGFKTYQKITKNQEMQDFLTLGLSYIEDYGEYKAVEKLKAMYKNVSSLNDLLRLEGEAMNRGDIRDELEGVKARVMQDNRVIAEKKKLSKIERSKTLIQIIWIILGQAMLGIIVAMLTVRSKY